MWLECVRGRTHRKYGKIKKPIGKQRRSMRRRRRRIL
jgi:hypothetical protein